MLATNHILVIRFSSMGDVAMTIPVLKNLLQQNQQLRITVISNAFFEPLFNGLERCDFYPVYLKGQHKGLKGMLALYKALKSTNKFSAVADLHNVLRSTIIRSLFAAGGVKVASIEKGRKEKMELTRKKDKICRQLTSTHDRYAEVFRNIGFNITLDNTAPVYQKQLLPEAVQSNFTGGKAVIGIAPFAQYAEKMYPLEKMKLVIKQLVNLNYTVLLFGGGAGEVPVLQEWEREIPGCLSCAGKFSFSDELAIVSNLHLMVSMDSANMHLAALYNVPVVSIWGATHAYAGFYGWGPNKNNIIEIDLYCRPCSVFGNKPCYRGDHACMNWLPVEQVMDKIQVVIGVNK